MHPTPFKWFVTVCVSRGKSLVGDTCPKNQTTPKTLGLNAHIVGEPLFLPTHFAVLPFSINKFATVSHFSAAFEAQNPGFGALSVFVWW